MLPLRELALQPEWRALSPKLRRALSMYIESGATNMRDVLTSMSGGRDVTDGEVEELLKRPEVVAVLERWKNGIDYSHLKSSRTGENALKEFLQKQSR